MTHRSEETTVVDPEHALSGTRLYSLKALLNPRSVAIVGATQDPKRYGFYKTKEFLDGGFKGRSFLVNPKSRRVFGRRTYPTLSSIKQTVDLVTVLVRSDLASDIVEEATQIGVKGFVVVSSGFAETSDRGARIQDEIVRIAHRVGARIIGPNSFGIFSANSNLNLAGLSHVPRGGIGVVAHSGNIVRELYYNALQGSVGFSHILEVGNESDIKVHECLEFLRGDPGTHSVALYLESVKDGQGFIEQGSLTTTVKPVVAYKAGKSALGQEAARSHSAALAGDARVCSAAFRKAGIVEARESSDLLDFAETLLCQPPAKADGLAIITEGGGHATIAADYVETLPDLSVVPLSESARDALRALSRFVVRTDNPVDIGASAITDGPLIFAKATKVLLDEPQVAALLVTGLFGGYGKGWVALSPKYERDEARVASKLASLGGQKPIVFHSVYAREKDNRAIRNLRKKCIPVYDSVEKALRCLAALRERSKMLAQLQGSPLVLSFPQAARDYLDTARMRNKTSLSEIEAMDLLQSLGIDFAPHAVVETSATAKDAAATLGFPVAMKLATDQPIHKTERGLVKLNLPDETSVATAFDELISAAAREGESNKVLLSKMMSGVELFAGLRRDVLFGPVILFGLGGILTETLQDVDMRLCPLTREDVHGMISRTKAGQLMGGYRGLPAVNMEKLMVIFQALNSLGMEAPEVKEVDLNPILVRGDAATPVDARIFLS